MGRKKLSIKEIDKRKKGIIAEINKLHSEGVDLYDRNMRKHYVEVYGPARYHFGSWKEAIEVAGFDYSKIKKEGIPKKLSPEEKEEKKKKIIAEIKSLHSKGTDLRKAKLMNAAVKYFDSFEKAVEAAGIRYCTVISSRGMGKRRKITHVLEKYGEMLEEQIVEGAGIGDLEKKKGMEGIADDVFITCVASILLTRTDAVGSELMKEVDRGEIPNFISSNFKLPKDPVEALRIVQEIVEMVKIAQ